jgi:Ca-activated chloride channel family protein
MCCKLGVGLLTVSLSLCAMTACFQEQDSGVARIHQALEARCVDAVEDAPETGWICPNDLTVECSDPEGTDVEAIFSEPPEARQCSELELSVSPNGPFALGTHHVQVSSSLDGGTLLCEAELTVVDTTPPEVTPKRVEIWPPNHEFHAISAADCFDVVDTCDAQVDAAVLWATSDEPVDDIGDGTSEPDLQFSGCDVVQLRAERQGPGNGRVYRLGWEFSDDEGNTTERVCEVFVPHDQGHPGVEPADTPPAVEIDNDPECERASRDAGP